MTQECLASVRTHTQNVAYEIIVVDNGSKPDELPVVRDACDLHGARLIELNQNLFFGEANNIGVEAARGGTILLLNNDVLVTPGYIAPLLHVLETAHRAGAVGAELRYPDGRLQEAGLAQNRGLPIKANAKRVFPVTGADYTAAAVRPKNSRLETSLLRERFRVHLPDWKLHASRFVDEIARSRLL